jgi:hypothetical protein
MATIKPLTTRGTDKTFVKFSARREGSAIVLSAVLVQYNVFSGSELHDVLDTKMVEEDDAVNTACDLEWIAEKRLDETNDLGTKYPCGFAEAVEKWLDTAELKAA